MSAYVLILVVLSQWGSTSKDIPFATTEACELAKSVMIAGLTTGDPGQALLTTQNSVFQVGCFPTGWVQPPSQQIVVNPPAAPVSSPSKAK